MYRQNDPRPANLTRTFVASCVLEMVLLFWAGPAARAGDFQGSSSSQRTAEELRTEALQFVKKATLQDLRAAVTRLRQSARLFRAAHLDSAAAADYLSIGEIYFVWSRYEKALRMYRLAEFLDSTTDLDLNCSILS